MDEKGNKNFIPVVVNIGYGDSLVFKGLNYDTNIKSIVTLQHDQKSLVRWPIQIQYTIILKKTRILNSHY